MGRGRRGRLDVRGAGCRWCCASVRAGHHRDPDEPRHPRGAGATTSSDPSTLGPAAAGRWLTWVLVSIDDGSYAVTPGEVLRVGHPECVSSRRRCRRVVEPTPRQHSRTPTTRGRWCSQAKNRRRERVAGSGWRPIPRRRRVQAAMDVAVAALRSRRIRAAREPPGRRRSTSAARAMRSAAQARARVARTSSPTGPRRGSRSTTASPRRGWGSGRVGAADFSTSVPRRRRSTAVRRAARLR